MIRCCCRRPARASTSSATSRTGATSSGQLVEGIMIKSISGKIKAKAALIDPEPLRPLRHERDRPLVLGDRQGPAAAGHGADRDRPDRRRRRVARRSAALFGRQRPLLRALLFLAPARVDRGRRAGDDRHLDDAARSARGACRLFGAAFFFVLLVFVPIIGPEHNGARRWIEFGVGQVQPSEFLKPFFVVSMAWLLSLRDGDKSLPVYPISAARDRRRSPSC